MTNHSVRFFGNILCSFGISLSNCDRSLSVFPGAVVEFFLHVFHLVHLGLNSDGKVVNMLFVALRVLVHAHIHLVLVTDFDTSWASFASGSLLSRLDGLHVSTYSRLNLLIEFVRAFSLFSLSCGMSLHVGNTLSEDCGLVCFLHIYKLIIISFV
jgi:hypothetical protein